MQNRNKNLFGVLWFQRKDIYYLKFLFCCLWVKVLGKVGRIARITPKKDVVVSFGRKHWVFNIACLRPCPGAEVDQIEEEDDLSLSIGMNFQISTIVFVSFPLFFLFNLSFVIYVIRGNYENWLIKYLKLRVFAVARLQHGDSFYCMLPTKNSKVHVLKGRFKHSKRKKS